MSGVFDLQAVPRPSNVLGTWLASREPAPQVRVIPRGLPQSRGV